MPDPARSSRTSRARTLRRDQTEAERKLWRLISNRQLGGFKFRRQYPISRYFVDFACHEASLVVEVDGGQHAGNPRDVIRDKWLADHNYRVLRFWNNDVLTNLDGVYQAIAETLAGITPTQTLPHQGGGLRSTAGQ